MCPCHSVAKHRTKEVKKTAAQEKREKKLLARISQQMLQHNIIDCYVNLGARVDESKDVPSTDKPVKPLSEISMAQFNQEIVMKSR